MFGLLIILLVLLLFVIEWKNCGWKNVFVSSFWIFTLFYMFAYPVKFVLITILGVEYIAPVKASSDFLHISLALSALFWVIVYLFHTNPYTLLSQTNSKNQVSMEVKGKPNSISLQNVFLISVVIVSLFLLIRMWIEGNFKMSSFYNNQNLARFGAGHVFILYSVYIYAFYVFLFFVKSKTARLVFVISVFVVMAGFLETTLLSTRRPLFLIIYALALFYYLRNKSEVSIYTLILLPALAVLMSPIGHLLVRLQSFDSIDVMYILTSIGSTFEGIEHLANYLTRVDTSEFLFGVDFGSAWIYNSGLAKVPRVIWESKPLFAGSLAEQQFIYPEKYIGGPAQTTLPPGLVVDSLYGFGVFSMLVFAVLYSKLFSYMDRILFRNELKFGFPLLFSAVLYIYMFNLVRGGTTVIMLLVVLFVFSMFIKVFETLKPLALHRRG